MPNARVIPVVACLLALAACGSPSATPSATTSASASASASAPSASASASASATATDSLDGITVKGKQGDAPKVTFKAPFVIDKTRTTVLSEGSGDKALADGTVTVDYYGVVGRTGEKFDDSFSRGAPATFSLAQVVTGFKLGLTGQRAGSRVLIAMPGSDGYDAAGGNSDAGIEVGDTLVFVVDVLAVSVAAPSGKVVEPPAGMPTVTGGPTDKPTVTISGSAPTKMATATLIEGAGAKVGKDDTITARYVGYSWKTGKLIDDGFDTPSSGALSSTIPGWISTLPGKRVGSRILLVLPPADGFPKGSNNPPVEAGDTVVYVVDLLFTQASA